MITRTSESPSWKEYVQEIFHILGFSTEEKAPRLYILKDIGSNIAAKAMVLYILPSENFEHIVPGIDWESHLFFAVNYFHIEWEH